ncbi:MAG: hypothetical protein WDW38_001613 [Sanguina aurantia]
MDKTAEQRAKRRRLLSAAQSARVRKGMIRYVMLAVDLSIAALGSDLRPNRLTCMLTICKNFIREFFDQNPLSQLGILLMRNGLAERLTELSGSPESQIKKLSERLPALCLPLCRISVVGVAAEVYVCSRLARDTGGTYGVALSESHLEELMMRHAPPPAATAEQAGAELVRMGFPQRSSEDPAAATFVGPNATLASGSYGCPRCKAKVAELPCECHVCGLTLVSSPHLARSYHHLFPIAPYDELPQDSGSEQGSEGDPDSPCASEDADDVEVIAVVPAPDSKRQKLSTVSGTQRAASTGQAAQHTLDSFVTSHRAGPSQAAKQAPPHQPNGNLRQSLIVSSFGLTNASDPNSARCRQPGGCSTAATADESRMALAQLVNHRVFGNRSFRPRQREIIDFALSGKDCFVLMPTGGGKSLCYQLPAVIARGVTVVVCPLLSLMQDQVRALCTGPGGGVPATYLSSQQSQSEASAVYRELSKACPTVKLLYATPEQLVKSSGLRRLLDQLHASHRLARIVIDEAHCVSMWGHDFRPDYKHLSFLKGAFPTVPIMALTATATERVAKDILSTLGIPRAPVFQVNFFRENLRFMVQDKPYGKDEQGMPGHYAALVDYIEGQAEGCTGIVYCLSRDESEQVARFLCQSTDITAAAYHAGMTPKVRMEVQNKWRSGKVQVVVATIAFGMGIDKPDVRYVVHFTLSKSLEGYFQEAGRAGRDGLPSECVLMFAPRDGPRILNMLRMGPRASYKAGQEQLQHMIEYCKEGGACRHAILLKHFGQQLAGGASRCKTSCDNCDQRNRPKPQAAYEQDYQEYADCYDGDEGSGKPKPGAGGGSDSRRPTSKTPGIR